MYKREHPLLTLDEVMRDTPDKCGAVLNIVKARYYCQLAHNHVAMHLCRTTGDGGESVDIYWR